MNSNLTLRNPRLAKKIVNKASTKTSTKNLLRVIFKSNFQKFSSQKSMPKVVAKGMNFHNLLENPKTCRLLNIKVR